MDTVIIKITGPNRFTVSTAAKLWFLPELAKREFNQLTQAEKQSTRIYLRHFVLKHPYFHEYIPKVEMFEALNKERNAVVYILKLEFSVPKLIYGNSVQEVSERDYEKVLGALKRALASVGITVETDTLASARVSATHFCKNVVLPRNIRMQDILGELSRVDVSKVVDVTQKEIKHGGQVLHIYSGTIERVFYEKIADAMRPKVKRKDKGRMERERGVIKHHSLYDREVFRYEYRIKKTQTVLREINTALGREAKTFVAFRDLFQPNLFRKVILNTWRGLIQRPENQLALIGPVDDLVLLLHIITEAKKRGGAHSMNQALISYGLACAVRDHGAKEVRGVIQKGWNKDHCERLNGKIRTAVDLTRGVPFSNSIAFIDSALEKFDIITGSFLEHGL